MNITVCPLKQYLAEIAEVRKAKGLRHPLAAILCLCCVALLSGAQNPNAIAEWWTNRQDLGPILKRLGFERSYGPSKSTLYRVLSLVPLEALLSKVNQWAEENLSHWWPAVKGQLEGIAIDGKTLCGSQRQGAAQAHLLSAFSHRLGLTVGQVAIDDKTNEIGAMPDLLLDLVLEGRVFTMDALHTQRETAQTIVDGKGDYVMIVKENQPTLQADIALVFTGPDAPLFIEERAATLGKEHGRIEIRTVQTCSALNDFLTWPGVQQVFRLDRKTTLLKTQRVRRETVYGVTSLSPHWANATSLLQLVRGQWSIENRSHWVRDVTFGEDQSQVRKGHLPQVMATLRNVAIGLIRLCRFRFVPRALDYFASHPFEALAAIGC